MALFVITEKQNLQSLANGRLIEVKGLAAAKRNATAEQMFQGTVLSIEAPNGAELAYKKDGKWVDVNE